MKNWKNDFDQQMAYQAPFVSQNTHLNNVNICVHDEHQISNFFRKTKALEKHFELIHFALLFHWIFHENNNLQVFCQPEENSGEAN